MAAILEFCHLGFRHFAQNFDSNFILILCHPTWWWQPSWILPSWIQPFSRKLWFKWIVIFSQIHSFILTQPDDVRHLEFCNLGFNHFDKKITSFIHSDSTWWWQPSWILPSWIQPFWTKITSLIHSDSTWWWQPSWILPSWIQPAIFRHFVFFSQNSKTLSLHSDIDWNYFNLINLMMAAILNSTFLESAIFHKTLTQTNSIWFIHSDSTWWWQPSWILPCWIQPFWTKKLLHSFILTHLDVGSHLEFYHLAISHFEKKKTSLIHSDSSWWWQPSWILPCWI